MDTKPTIANLTVRLATAEDLALLAALYRETVLTHAPQHYSPAQTKAWADFGANTPQFHRFILGATTYVAEAETILGFGGLAADGHITALYVRHDCLGRGIGSQLLTTLLNQAHHAGMTRLYAEASAFSLGLFQTFGFCHYGTDQVERGGVMFERYLVEKMPPLLMLD